MNYTIVKRCLAAILILGSALGCAHCIPMCSSTEVVAAYASITISYPAMNGETTRSMEALKVSRNPKAAPFLAKHIDWHGDMLIGVSGGNTGSEDWYPAANALIEIGRSAVPAILDAVTSRLDTDSYDTKNEGEQTLLFAVYAWTLERILGQHADVTVIAFAASHPTQTVRLRKFAKDMHSLAGLAMGIM